MNIDQILENYRNGDLDMRLRLFLTYRDLRTRFETIENENAKRWPGSFVFQFGRRRKKKWLSL